MASSRNINPDSARDLNDAVGSDSTATFEDDPKFVDSNPTGTASSENLGADDVDETDDVDDEDTEAEEEDDADEAGEDPDDDEEVAEDEEVDEDEDLDDEDEDEDDEGDDEDSDDAEGNEAAPLKADGLLGYEDEADDVQKGRGRAQGDAVRAKAEGALKDGEDDDAGDVGTGVDEDDLDDVSTDDLDGQESSMPRGEANRIRKALEAATAMGARAFTSLELR